ncbi:predicted protein [Histoplasma capsulatum G186AR]|uniref:Uncharacterized protein n=1 Tax=Ajellomyces capsulatus (strain G186AR / H82 / ATCC MYA-2454 / RMSCC 2432) TaxID=447093 RepID=C0NV85_AJECG|nr:uncharacterized protein HCBG_07065 [Histoplasma capsulatum G186AR]EEH04424.1 predicted protein [Histoplasma capsulatum G186AR]
MNAACSSQDAAVLVETGEEVSEPNPSAGLAQPELVIELILNNSVDADKILALAPSAYLVSSHNSSIGKTLEPASNALLAFGSCGLQWDLMILALTQSPVNRRNGRKGPTKPQGNDWRANQAEESTMFSPVRPAVQATIRNKYRRKQWPLLGMPAPDLWPLAQASRQHLHAEVARVGDGKWFGPVASANLPPIRGFKGID